MTVRHWRARTARTAMLVLLAAVALVVPAANAVGSEQVSKAELERYGGGDVHDLLRRSFEFLLDRESNTSILREFDLGTIERYYPEYTAAMQRAPKT